MEQEPVMPVIPWVDYQGEIEEVMPRALSVDRDDPRWREDAAEVGSRLAILLDGAEQTNVITYDMDEGFLLRLKTDAAGKLVLNHERDDVETERVTGVVDLRLLLKVRGG